MDISRNELKILKYLYDHGENEIQELCYFALGNKRLENDPYLFEEIEQLEKQDLVHIYK